MTGGLPNSRTRSVVLLSGGLDSTTVLAIASAAGHELFALSFSYGQRHAVELECARRQAKAFDVAVHEIVDLSHFGRLVQPATALVSPSSSSSPGLEVPKLDVGPARGTAIPITYVPARNSVFLVYGLAWAETVGASEIHIGANAVDYSGYPDCRPAFLEAFETMANLATRTGVEGSGIRVCAPLVDFSKDAIIGRGLALGVDYSDTVSCYDPASTQDGVAACGRCESCELRRRGFGSAGVPDPTLYR